MMEREDVVDDENRSRVGKWWGKASYKKRAKGAVIARRECTRKW